eukprot:1605711-Rhodomonas_salina.1
MIRAYRRDLMNFAVEMDSQPPGADPMLTESRIGSRMAPFLNGMSNVVTASLEMGTAGLAHSETQAGR